MKIFFMILPYVIKYYDKYYYDRDYKYYYDKDYEIIGISDFACNTQSETVELNGNIVTKGIGLLAYFDPCKI